MASAMPGGPGDGPAQTTECELAGAFARSAPWHAGVHSCASAISPVTTDDLKTQFRQQSQAALSLNVAFIGVVNDLFRVLHDRRVTSSTALAESAGLDPGYV